MTDRHQLRHDAHRDLPWGATAEIKSDGCAYPLELRPRPAALIKSTQQPLHHTMNLPPGSDHPDVGVR